MESPCLGLQLALQEKTPDPSSVKPFENVNWSCLPWVVEIKFSWIEVQVTFPVLLRDDFRKSGENKHWGLPSADQ